MKITVTADGPYIVNGAVPLARQSIAVDERGQSIDWVLTAELDAPAEYALCRCGHSGSKPFCDGSHARVGFDGAETASHVPFADQAQRYDGPRYALLDVEPLCAFARFCDTHASAWKEVELSDDPEHAAILLAQANKCVSGRLVAIDAATGEPVEAPRAPRISAPHDPVEECAGPLFVEGGITVQSATGEPYEPRNRQALCRCG